MGPGFFAPVTALSADLGRNRAGGNQVEMVLEKITDVAVRLG
jgi:hypothetical protein